MKRSSAGIAMFSFLLINSCRGAEDDPLYHLNYHDAFDQDQIYKKYSVLLDKLGCTKNVDSVDQNQCITMSSVAENPALGEEKKKFEDECVAKLISSKNWANNREVLQSATWTALIDLASWKLIERFGWEKFAASLLGGVAATSNASTIVEVIKAGYRWKWPQEHALNPLEERFARNKCVIPNKLWPIIIDKFMLARQNPHEQRISIDFLQFALGMTVYEPRPALELCDSSDSIHGVIKDLHGRVDHFFEDYEEDKTLADTRNILKINVGKLMLGVGGLPSEPPRYISFHGPAGIGKTYFVRKLADWCEECMKGAVRLEEMVITSGVELEGNTERPGAMLRVLRNQLLDKKRGSLVFLDEANWLNNPDITASAKRVFNGGSHVATTYFGQGVEGAGINLPLPPLLLFVASNDEIEDPALKSRFDVIAYPLPKKTALVNHALKQVKESSLLKSLTKRQQNDASKDLNADQAWEKQVGNWKQGIEEWIESDVDNFRAVEAGTERLVLSLPNS